VKKPLELRRFCAAAGEIDRGAREGDIQITGGRGGAGSVSGRGDDTERGRRGRGAEDRANKETEKGGAGRRREGAGGEGRHSETISRVGRRRENERVSEGREGVRERV